MAWGAFEQLQMGSFMPAHGAPASPIQCGMFHVDSESQTKGFKGPATENFERTGGMMHHSMVSLFVRSFAHSRTKK